MENKIGKILDMWLLIVLPIISAGALLIMTMTTVAAFNDSVLTGALLLSLWIMVAPPFTVMAVTEIRDMWRQQIITGANE